MMKKYLILIVMFILVALFPVASFASIPDNLAIDFRTFSGADGQDEYTQDGVTVKALPNGYQLSYNDVDGLGVNGALGDPNEIGWFEKLKVTIDGGKYLTGVWITNLYDNEGLFGTLPEYGRVILNNDIKLTYNFYGNYLVAPNGDLFVSFGKGVIVTDALFETPLAGLGYSDFSVAGFTAPIPGSILLLGSGLAGLMGIRRKKNRAQS